MTSYVYIRSEPGLWTVGFYRPDGAWESDSDHDVREEAARRVAWLNGGVDIDVGSSQTPETPHAHPDLHHDHDEHDHEHDPDTDAVVEKTGDGCCWAGDGCCR